METRIDISNRIMNLQSFVLQELMDSVLSEKLGSEWPQKIYDYGCSRKEEKYRDYVEAVDNLGGRDYATKAIMDTTLAFQIIKYNSVTKGFFNFGKSFDSEIHKLKNGRNSIKHRLDTLLQKDTAGQAQFYYSLCFLQITELYSFIKLLKNNTTYNPANKYEILTEIQKKIEEIENDIGRELGDVITLNRVKSDLLSDAYNKYDISTQLRVWLREEVGQYISDQLSLAKKIEAFIRTIELKIVDINYFYILNERISNDTVIYNQYFTENSLIYFFNSLKSIDELNEIKLSTYNEYITSIASDEEVIGEYKKYDTYDEKDIRRVIGPLVIMMDISGKFAEQINRVYQKRRRDEAIDIYGYCDRLVTKFSSDDEIYVDIPWLENDNQGVLKEIHLESLITKPRRIKLWGIAGCGKSTALIHLTYLLANAVATGESEIIPVYVELNRLDTSHTILEEISDILSVSEDIVYSFINAGELVLLFDGYDEIQEDSVRKQFSKTVDGIMHEYPNCSIYLSDRSINSYPPVMKYERCINFCPVDLNIIIKLCENISNEKTKEIMKLEINNNPEYFYDFKTPLQIVKLIELINNTGSMPSNFVEEFIGFLMEREMDEKKNINIKYLKGSLEALALIEDDISILKAEYQIGRFLDSMHYTKADSKQILEISIGMGILRNVNGNISFSDSLYKDYFEIEGIYEGIDEILA